MATAPADVWHCIISLSDRRDITVLTRISRSFLSIARPILYRTVVLHSEKEAVKDTFDLLKRDRLIAGEITELCLITTTNPWIDIDALIGMKCLKSLKLTSPPFRTEWEQQEFISAVTKSCPLLTGFSYHGYDRFELQFPSERLEIAGLERLTWNEKRCYDAEDRNFEEEGREYNINYYTDEANGGCSLVLSEGGDVINQHVQPYSQSHLFAWRYEHYPIAVIHLLFPILDIISSRRLGRGSAPLHQQSNDLISYRPPTHLLPNPRI
jgi:hypothetical protein